MKSLLEALGLRNRRRAGDESSSPATDQLGLSGAALQSSAAQAAPQRTAASLRQVLYPGRIIVDEPTADFEARAIDVTNHQQRPFGADTLADGWSTSRFCVRAASIRGDGHRSDGAPRQDDLALATHADSGSVVVAVADGVSGAPESHLGAGTVCRYATGAVLRALDGKQRPDWSEILKGAAWALVELARRRLGTSADLLEAETLFATTLTIALVEPTSSGGARLSAVSAGDSAVWSLQGGELRQLLGGKDPAEQSELATSAVLALPRRLPSPHVLEEHELAPGNVVLVMTDGIGDPLGDGSGLIGTLLRSELMSPPPTLQFARITDFSRETFYDDRTLVAIWLKSGT